MHTEFKVLWRMRHGQSRGNIDEPTDNHANIPLTELGQAQAEKLAARIDRQPGLIVMSSFLRAQQTAAPLREKYPDVPVEVWPETAEFTYLSPARCHGTNRTERLPWVREYWQRQDPDYHDGAGAESFRDFVQRAEVILRRVRTRPEENIMIFSHGQFINCLIEMAIHPYASVEERMARFRSLPELPNAGLIYLLVPVGDIPSGEAQSR